MISERPPAPGSHCNTLAPGKNYLAATVNMLTEISHNTTANAWKVPNGYWSAKSSRDFDSCLRSNGTESCWDSPNFLQRIRKKPTDPEEGVVRIPETAMVGFGSKDRGSIQSLLSHFRTWILFYLSLSFVFSTHPPLAYSAFLHFFLFFSLETWTSSIASDECAWKGREMLYGVCLKVFSPCYSMCLLS